MALFNYDYQPQDPAQAFPSLLGALQTPAAATPTGAAPGAAPQARAPGIMGFLSDPRVRSMLAGMSQRFLEAGAPTMGGTSNMRALGMGLTGANEGLQSYEQQLASSYAKQIEQRMKLAELSKAEREANAKPTPFQGVGMEQQVANTLLDESIDPASPQWQYAYAQATQPRQEFDPKTGKMVWTTPSIPKAIKARYEAALAGSQATAPVVGITDPAFGSQQVTEGEQVAADNKAQDQWRTDKEWELRKEYDGNNLKLADYSSKLSQAEALLQSNQSGIADVALVNTFQKLIDEGAVVREGDVTLLSSTGGAFGSLRQMFQEVQGSGKLPPEVREQMLETIRILKNQFDQRRSGLANDYRSRASDFGLNADRIARPAEPVEQYVPSRLDRVRSQRGN